MKHFLSTGDCSRDELERLLAAANQFKSEVSGKATGGQVHRPRLFQSESAHARVDAGGHLPTWRQSRRP